MNARQRRTIEHAALAAGMARPLILHVFTGPPRHRASRPVDAPSLSDPRYRHPSGYGRHAQRKETA